MARSDGRGSLVAVVTVLALLAAPLPVLAAFAINIQGPPGAYGGAGITVTDNSGNDLNPLLGQIDIEAGSSVTLPAIPGFLFSIDSAVSNSPGGPPNSLLRLSWTLVSSSGGTIHVTASAQDYTFPPAGVGAVLTSTVLGSVNNSGSLTAQQWVDLGNGHFTTVGPPPASVITPGEHGAFGPGLINDTLSADFITLGTPYSITERVDLTLGSNSSTFGALQSTVVPEPVTMFLGGTGLLMLAYAARRRLFAR